MARRIRQVPTLSHLSLAGRGGRSGHPIDAPRQAFWYSGQIAIWQGIRALGLKEGDRVLVPAYCCGSEIDALIKAGLSLAFYRIGPDLNADMEHLEALCAEPAKALFIIHYFGLPQPLDALIAFADKHHLLLIEDNAHGLSSDDDKGRPLGSLGDICIFSFTKTLALPDGGALTFGERAKTSGEALESEAPGLGPTLGKLARILRGSASHKLPAVANATRWARGLLGQDVDEDDFDAEPDAEADAEKYLLDVEQASRRMSSISHFLLRHTNHSAIRDIRRRNFSQLLRNVEGGARVRPLLSHLPPGCSPMMFPVRAEDPVALLRHLLKAGLESDIFWDFTHPAVSMAAFPFEQDLKQRCIEIPVHQCLRAEDVTVMINALNDWNARRA